MPSHGWKADKNIMQDIDVLQMSMAMNGYLTKSTKSNRKTRIESVGDLSRFIRWHVLRQIY